MRFVTPMFLILFAASVSLAQSPPAPPGLEVAKFSWSKERIGWERDPFGGPLENFDEMRARARNEKRLDDAKRGGSSEADRIKREAKADAANISAKRQQSPPRYAFLYKASFRNNGATAIKEIDWDYVFFDAATGEEVGRHQFTNDEKIEPGKKKEFSFFIPSPPARIISVYALNDKERQGLTEQVVLMRVVYADGSVWKRPQSPPATR